MIVVRVAVVFVLFVVTVDMEVVLIVSVFDIRKLCVTAVNIVDTMEKHISDHQF